MKKAILGKLCPNCKYLFSVDELNSRIPEDISKLGQFICPSCGKTLSVKKFYVPQFEIILEN